jgi:hypothetical protein
MSEESVGHAGDHADSLDRSLRRHTVVCRRPAAIVVFVEGDQLSAPSHLGIDGFLSIHRDHLAGRWRSWMVGDCRIGVHRLDKMAADASFVVDGWRRVDSGDDMSAPPKRRTSRLLVQSMPIKTEDSRFITRLPPIELYRTQIGNYTGGAVAS